MVYGTHIHIYMYMYIPTCRLMRGRIKVDWLIIANLLVLPARQGAACWSSQRDRELRVGPPSATGSCVLVLPARQGAACWSSQRDRELRVGPPSATGSCVLVLPARQGAACWSSQRDRELRVGPPSATGSCVLVLPARQGAVVRDIAAETSYHQPQLYANIFATENEQCSRKDAS